MKKILIALACLSCLVSLFFLFSCSSLNNKFRLPDDNIVEQYFEWLINRETGLDLDLTPNN